MEFSARFHHPCSATGFEPTTRMVPFICCRGGEVGLPGADREGIGLKKWKWMKFLLIAKAPFTFERKTVLRKVLFLCLKLKEARFRKESALRLRTRPLLSLAKKIQEGIIQV